VPVVLRTARRHRPGIIVADPKALTPSARKELGSLADEYHIPLIVGWADHTSLLRQVGQAIGPPEPPEEQSQKLIVGSLQMDLAARVVRLGEESLDLTPREFELLDHFVRHPNRVYSRQELLERVWGYEYGDPQVVTVHIANLRKKAKAVAPEYKLIETVHNIGYRFVVPAATLGAAAPSDSLPKQSRRPTRIIVGSVVAGVVMLVGLGVGLWLGLGEGDGTNSASSTATVVADDQSAMVRWGPQTVTEKDDLGNVFWQATWWVHARQGGDPYGRWGSEVMDWSVTLPPPTAPPLGRNETANLLYLGFERVGDASVATVIFSFDTTDWDHPGPPYEPFPNPVYHKFVLTDNPGSQSDHVEGWAGRPSDQPYPDGSWGLKFIDIDCSGVQVFYYSPPGDGVSPEETSTTQD
jgi:DNA-binding winged helix-turn-helix (wHTH) protein